MLEREDRPNKKESGCCRSNGKNRLTSESSKIARIKEMKAAPSRIKTNRSSNCSTIIANKDFSVGERKKGRKGKEGKKKEGMNEDFEKQRKKTQLKTKGKRMVEEATYYQAWGFHFYPAPVVWTPPRHQSNLFFDPISESRELRRLP
jgi:hypothetical protein